MIIIIIEVIPPSLFAKVDLNFRIFFQSLVQSTQNAELAGNKYLVPERGILSYHGDMYLTTTQKDHRAFTK